MTHAKKTILLVLAILAIAGLTACGGDDGETNAGAGTITVNEQAQPNDGGDGSEVTTIVVRDGEPVGGVAELEYSAGDQIRFRVRSNVADEVHVHGYDVSEEVPAGGSATLSFPADLEGIYEVELHGSEQQIAELRVNP